jgi:hypothetical protein
MMVHRSITLSYNSSWSTGRFPKVVFFLFFSFYGLSLIATYMKSYAREIGSESLKDSASFMY